VTLAYSSMLGVQNEEAGPDRGNIQRMEAKCQMVELTESIRCFCCKYILTQPRHYKWRCWTKF